MGFFLTSQAENQVVLNSFLGAFKKKKKKGCANSWEAAIKRQTDDATSPSLQFSTNGGNA